VSPSVGVSALIDTTARKPTPSGVRGSAFA
jgi:hypothetical protein